MFATCPHAQRAGSLRLHGAARRGRTRSRSSRQEDSQSRSRPGRTDTVLVNMNFWIGRRSKVELPGKLRLLQKAWVKQAVVSRRQGRPCSQRMTVSLPAASCAKAGAWPSTAERKRRIRSLQTSRCNHTHRQHAANGGQRNGDRMVLGILQALLHLHTTQSRNSAFRKRFET